MLFNSIGFFVFLFIVFFLYWGLEHRYRWILLLVASYYFYMSWNVKYVALILFTTGISYVCALGMENKEDIKLKKLLLCTAMVSSLGILFFFKYFNFFMQNVSGIMSFFMIRLHPVTLQLLLPVGISFYTFQTLSYVIDVYRGKVRAERHFGIYATFISFFPQLVAGPIERTGNLLPQIKTVQEFDYNKATYGLKLAAWGFFKKIVIADTLAVYVDQIYGHLHSYQGFSLILACVFFTFQIYCDFSGYSDIAIGTAKLFGIDLMTNFKSPYFSSTLREFWGRWHISLSSWFRDYVYIPLGGNRCGSLRCDGNQLATFLLSGLWHGANWTYIIWGGIHGCALIIEKKLGRNKGRGRSGGTWLLSVILIFLFCNFAWIFFRADSLEDSFYIIANSFKGISDMQAYFAIGWNSIDATIGGLAFVQILGTLLILCMFDFASLKYDVIQTISKQNLWFRWSVYITFVLMIVLLAQKGGAVEFVYFQF